MTIILGAGISGISAGYHLTQKGIENIIFEKDDDWGGLCSNFTIDGFRFDKAIHLSFSENKSVQKIFSDSCTYYIHKPLAYNYYKGAWLKHPAQNNLFPLLLDEKISIITDFVENKYKNDNITNYEEWLRYQYGEYFSSNFPIPYTKKYWTLEASELSTTWVENRMYKPNISEVLKGAFEDTTPNTYYAKEMRYPKKGGYKSFLRGMYKKCQIELDKDVVKIDIQNKVLYFKDKTLERYDELISSIPLPEYMDIIEEMPIKVKEACIKLKYTSIALVSLGFNKMDIPKHLWFYIYDEDIAASRCYSPSMKSLDNVPKGCSSLQFEIYFSKDKPLKYIDNYLVEHIIEKSIEMKLFQREDIVISNQRILKYGNVIFYKGMEKDRKVVLDYLKSLNIKTIGRFGRWDYFWSDQSLLSGVE